MFKKNFNQSIRVVTVKKIKNTGYPKASEKVDFSFSKAKTWPFHSLIVSSLLLVSLKSEASNHTNSTVLQNPFRSDAVRMPSYGGKGGPATLPKELAVETILQGFKENGINMKTDVPYKQSGVTVALDGYDPKTNIGFEFIESTCPILAPGQDNPTQLDQREQKKLYQNLADKKAKIIPVIGLDQRFLPKSGSKEDAIHASENLKKTIHQYIEFLRQQGAL